MRGDGDLAQVAVGVEMAVSAGGPLVDGGTDFGWRDRRVLASQTGFDHALGGLEQVKDSEALVWLVPHIFTLMDAAFLPAVWPGHLAGECVAEGTAHVVHRGRVEVAGTAGKR